MGIIERRRERKARMAHAKKRAAELLPLCEETLGARLEKPFRMERSSRLRHAVRYAIDRLSFMLGLPAPDTYPYLASKAMHKRLLGYFDTSRWVMGVNLSLYVPGHPLSEYTLVHEIAHAIFEQPSVSAAIREGLDQESNRVLGEGAAGFYGGLVMRRLTPDCGMLSAALSADGCNAGDRFFKEVASALGDPLTAMKSDPPLGRRLIDGGASRDSEIYDFGAYIRRIASGPFRSPRPS